MAATRTFVGQCTTPARNYPLPGSVIKLFKHVQFTKQNKNLKILPKSSFILTNLGPTETISKNMYRLKKKKKKSQCP